MEGEDQESNDPRAFGNAKWWKKIIILAAGACMNFLLGFLLVLMLVCFSGFFPGLCHPGAGERGTGQLFLRPAPGGGPNL